jgi:hypothetical protein
MHRFISECPGIADLWTFLLPIGPESKFLIQPKLRFSATFPIGK